MSDIYYVAVNNPWNVGVSAGDVIGLGCDLNGGKLHVSLNGDWLPPQGLEIDLPQV